MKDFVETRMLESVRSLLSGRVNEILQETEFAVPVIEFGEYECGSTIVPVISLASCERSEKERIVRLDVYSLTISFSLPESPESEVQCHAVAAAVEQALLENPALGGAADRAVLAGKKYTAPKTAHCGEGREIVLNIRITVEAMSNKK